jgi:hypothetical protein
MRQGDNVLAGQITKVLYILLLIPTNMFRIWTFCHIGYAKRESEIFHVQTTFSLVLTGSVADLDPFDTDLDSDPAFHFGTDTDLDPTI